MPSLANFHLSKQNPADIGTNQIKVNERSVKSNHLYKKGQNDNQVLTAHSLLWAWAVLLLGHHLLLLLLLRLFLGILLLLLLLVATRGRLLAARPRWRVRRRRVAPVLRRRYLKRERKREIELSLFKCPAKKVKNSGKWVSPLCSRRPAPAPRRTTFAPCTSCARAPPSPD